MSERVSAVAAGGSHRLGNVVTGQVFDTRDIPPSNIEVHQTNFVARRTRLSQTHAAVVAALAFGRVAA